MRNCCVPPLFLRPGPCHIPFAGTALCRDSEAGRPDAFEVQLRRRWRGIGSAFAILAVIFGAVAHHGHAGNQRDDGDDAYA